MKKISYFLAAFLMLVVTLESCNKNDGITPSDKGSINNFVWKGMNSWYNWQTSVPDLSDTKDDDFEAYNSYLNGYSTPEELFYSLLSQEETKVDPDTGEKSYRFSWIVNDYVALNKQFQGIAKSYGLRLQAVDISDSNDLIILYVRYVNPDFASPANNAGIKRGDVSNALDGVVLTESNYNDTVGKLSNETVTLSIVTENGTLIADKTITAVEISEDPVYLKKVFADINGKKVGYLVYNGFRSSYNDELNAAFAYFKSEGIQELVLDLRLNGGGSVETTAYLASMIYANAGNDKFAELKYNSKHLDRNGTANFSNTLNIYDVNGKGIGNETINRLTNITQLYVLTSGSTASASEMIINGLRPFIPVKVVGTKTYGKNVGSITLYDSPSSDYTKESSANSSHLYAMQPIVFQIYNKLDQSDYTNGFEPDLNLKVEEFKFWYNILPFGDENEVVLKAALDDIRGISAKQAKSLKFSKIKEVEVSKLEKRFDKEMYITDEFFNQ